MNPQSSPVEYADVDDTIPYSPLVENDHGPHCRHDNTCVNCGGCACGLVPRTCADPGCYSTAQAEADAYRDEYDGGYEDYDDDWYGDFDEDADVEHDDGDGAGCDCGTC